MTRSGTGDQHFRCRWLYELAARQNCIENLDETLTILTLVNICQT